MNQFVAEILRDQYKKLVKLHASLCGFDSLEEFIEEYEASGSPQLNPEAKVYLARKERYGEDGEESLFEPGNVKWANVRDDVELATLLAPAIRGEVGNE
jgi:hypothetical protein